MNLFKHIKIHAFMSQRILLALVLVPLLYISACGRGSCPTKLTEIAAEILAYEECKGSFSNCTSLNKTRDKACKAAGREIQSSCNVNFPQIVEMAITRLIDNRIVYKSDQDKFRTSLRKKEAVITEATTSKGFKDFCHMAPIEEIIQQCSTNMRNLILAHEAIKTCTSASQLVSIPALTKECQDNIKPLFKAACKLADREIDSKCTYSTANFADELYAKIESVEHKFVQVITDAGQDLNDVKAKIKAALDQQYSATNKMETIPANIRTECKAP